MPELQEADQWQTMFTPEALAAYGALDRSLYVGDFDPAGDWTQTWQIWLLRRSERDVNHRGFMRTWITHRMRCRRFKW